MSNTKVRILRYKASKGARRLKEALEGSGMTDVKMLKLSGSTYRGYPTHFILNWGSSDRRTIREGIEILNPPEAVRLAQNKIKTFENLETTPTPEWTTDGNVAEGWLSSGECDKVYCRKLIGSREGKGIIVANNPSEVVDAPLYTKGLEIQRELRVHVFNGNVIDYIQKKRMRSERLSEEGIETPCMDIRNHKNGWVFARSDVQLPEDAGVSAINAIKELGLDFGAVDIVVTPQGACKVLEVNTAPGLEGTTLERYKEALIANINENR